MEEKTPKSNVLRTQARDFVFKMFNHVKRKWTMGQCVELQSLASEAYGYGLRRVQRSHGEEDWQWNKTMVINNIRIKMCVYKLCVMGWMIL
jgi:hypothetical protein